MRGISTASLPLDGLGMSRKAGHHLLGSTEFASVLVSQSPSASRHNLLQLGGSKLQGLARTGNDWTYCFWRPIADTYAERGGLVSLPAGRRKTDWVTDLQRLEGIQRQTVKERARAARGEDGKDVVYLKATRNGFQGSDALADSSQLTNSLMMLAAPIQRAFIGRDMQQANVRFLRFCD